MSSAALDSEFLCYVVEQGFEPGDRLPSLADLSAQIGISVGKLREQLEVARTLGLVEASPRRGITRTAYSFLPAVRLSLLTALMLDRSYFDDFSALRVHLETAYWDEAVALLTPEDHAQLRSLVAGAQAKLSQQRIQIPSPEHRELHLTIFRRLNNPFVVGLLEAYWDAYEAVELNTYADIHYLQQVWDYHARIVAAIEAGDIVLGKQLLVEHMQLLSHRGISIESRQSELTVVA
ncbi:MAG: FadR family transcriptional regulator [Caldilineaceae bacterium]|nr:FadR family transcriptional regulator [Caldilineaceae bacterium]